MSQVSKRLYLKNDELSSLSYKIMIEKSKQRKQQDEEYEGALEVEPMTNILKSYTLES